MSDWYASGDFELERNGMHRQLKVSARRYRDGAFQGCIVVPARHGTTTHTVELSAPEVRQTRELLADTRSAFRNALAQGRTIVSMARPSDVVGGFESVDIVGELGRHTPFAGPDIIGGMVDIVGFDISSILQSAGQIGGMIPGAGPIIQGITGLASQIAQAAQGPRLTPEQQAAAVQGVSSGVGGAMAALAAAEAARRARESGASQAQQQEAANAAIREARQNLPGVASAGSSSNAPPSVAGASIGAAELLSRALASLALERGSDQQALADAARVARTALRAVDARAAAQVGDAQARQAIHNAVASTESRVARALRIALALTG